MVRDSEGERPHETHPDDGFFLQGDTAIRTRNSW